VKREIELTVNGERRKLLVKPNELLLNVIRGKLGLTGTKYGCGGGECGACTVLVDGRPVLSCLTLAVAVDGKDLTTIEGIGTDENPHPLQRAFVEAGAVQCGFCTPGMILSAKALLDRNPNPTRDEIKRALGGNLCRCTGYVKIIEAVELAAEHMRGGRGEKV
jgi:carbon-monoxide dehydrogenase small subunit